MDYIQFVHANKLFEKKNNEMHFFENESFVNCLDKNSINFIFIHTQYAYLTLVEAFCTSKTNYFILYIFFLDCLFF